MSSDSMLYTIGTALRRAQDTATAVEVLVEGQWVTGDVLAVDGHGVVLASDDPRDPGAQSSEHAVIRMASVSAVRVRSAAPFRRIDPGGPGGTLPGPRPASD